MTMARQITPSESSLLACMLSLFDSAAVFGWLLYFALQIAKKLKKIV